MMEGPMMRVIMTGGGVVLLLVVLLVVLGILALVKYLRSPS